MIIFECEQGTQEWIDARLGVVTASEAKKIVTNSGRISAQREQYMGELLAEYFLGEPYSDFEGNYYTERGKALEPQAYEYFSFHTDIQPRQVGFVYKDDSKLVGCSPDGLIGDNVPLELKCVNAGKHLVWLSHNRCPKEYHAQVQFQIWVMGAEYGWFMAYYPELPPLVVKVQPDPDFHETLDKHIPLFVDELQAARDRLIDMGVQRND